MFDTSVYSRQATPVLEPRQASFLTIMTLAFPCSERMLPTMLSSALAHAAFLGI